MVHPLHISESRPSLSDNQQSRFDRRLGFDDLKHPFCLKENQDYIHQDLCAASSILPWGFASRPVVELVGSVLGFCSSLTNGFYSDGSRRLFR